MESRMGWGEEKMEQVWDSGIQYKGANQLKSTIFNGSKTRMEARKITERAASGSH